MNTLNQTMLNLAFITLSKYDRLVINKVCKPDAIALRINKNGTTNICWVYRRPRTKAIVYNKLLPNKQQDILFMKSDTDTYKLMYFKDNKHLRTETIQGYYD